MAGEVINQVFLADGRVLMSVTDTTATPETVTNGRVFYASSGARSVGTMNIKLDEAATYPEYDDSESYSAWDICTHDGKIYVCDGATAGVWDEAKWTEKTLEEFLDEKVDKESGKGLSTNDFTTAEKEKLAGVAEGATANVGTITGITMNGTSKGTSGVVDLGTVITEHQDISGKVDASEKGEANGIAELDENGKVPAAQLPGFVDDVVDGYYYNNKFYKESTHETEIPGEAGKVYIDVSTNITYRWSGSAFVPIGSDLALGETSSTAYRGDRGAAAYAAAVTNVDTTPTEESTHLITSGGVAAAIPDISTKADKTDTVLNTTLSRGRKANTTVGTGSFAFGNNVIASGNYSQAEGYNTYASGYYSHAEGSKVTASGQASHAEGYASTASTYGAFGKGDHAEGYNTIANSGTSSSYYAAHAEGKQTTATGNAAHAEGDNTTASGAASHAEGYGTTASGSYSHAEGFGPTASGSYSHAEGNNTTASGAYSHVEGNNTKASGQASHAEGYRTKAQGNYAHAEGWNTIASYCQHVVGKSNVPNTSDALQWPTDTTNIPAYDPNKDYYAKGSLVKYNNSVYVSHSETSPKRGSPKYDTYNWHSYTSTTTGTEPEWQNETEYAQNTIVKLTDSSGTVAYYQNHSAIVGTRIQAGTNEWLRDWHTQPSGTYPVDPDYVEIVGWSRGEYTDPRNIRVVDHEGNERLAGDLYIHCDDDSTGGTKVTPLPAVTSSDNGKSLEVSNGSWATGSKKIDKEYNTDDWVAKTWEGLTITNGEYIWTDGDNIYYSNYSDQYVYDKSTSTWSTKSWTGLTSFRGNCVWTDGENVYHSYDSNHYVLDKSTSTWSAKTWTGLANFRGDNIWTDGENIYYSSSSLQRVLNKSTSTWSTKTWTGLTSFNGSGIWTNGENIYYSSGSTQRVLDKSNSAWTSKSWTGLTNFSGLGIWTDGENIYYSSGSNHYVLDESTSTWSEKTWTGLTSFGGIDIWTNGENIYYSSWSNQYELNKPEDQILIGHNGEFSPVDLSSIMPEDELPDVSVSDNGKSLEVSNGSWATGTKKIDKEYTLPDDWSAKTWSGLTTFYGNYIWTDKENIYYSNGSTQYVLNKSTSAWSTKTWTLLTSFYGGYIWTDGENIYYSAGSTQYVLDKPTSAWSTKTWTGLTNFYGERIWTDGENIYYSDYSTQYVLDKSTSTWSAKTWTGLTSFDGNYIWTDGENTYFSVGADHYVFDKSTSTWSAKIWTGLTIFNGDNIWTDGENIYYSYSSTQYILDKSTSTWNAKTWTGGLTSFSGVAIWTDRENTYYSDGSNQYKLNKPEDQILIGRNGEFTSIPVSAFSIPGTLPAVTSTDNGKVLKVVSGDWAAAEASTDFPAAPSSDGTYILQCSVSSGIATYSWVSLPNASGVSF